MRGEDLLLSHSNLLITLLYAYVIYVNKVSSQFHETTGMNLAELRDATADRRKWRGLIMKVARVQGTDSTR